MAATIVCSQCGATNRVDVARARGLQPSCGRCHALLLPAAPDPIEVTDARFDEQVLDSPLPVLLDVWAPWCLPCRDMEPLVHDLAASLAGRVRVAKLDVDRNPAAAARLRIQGVPTLILFKAGQELTRMIGVRKKDEVLGAVSALV
jgi:thioredoxin 2